MVVFCLKYPELASECLVKKYIFYNDFLLANMYAKAYAVKKVRK